MSSTATRRGRLSRTGSSATEDQALNQIAHEAEARLSAKRAARAEARTIRMKELERQQKEADAEMDKQYKINATGHAGRSSSVGGASTIAKDENDAEMNGPLVPEKALKSVQDNLRETEDKYRKAMVSIAQLDNEKQALLYQVDCLKDRMDEEQEVSSEVKNELTDLTKECNRHQRTIKDRDDQIQRLKDAITFRDNWLAERGLSLFEEKDEDELSAPEEGVFVTDNPGIERNSVSDTDRSRSNSQSSKASVTEEKEALIVQVRKLQEEILVLKRGENDPPKTITADLEELRREFTRQINDFRIKLQKAEQENARLEGVVMRLESQVKRYKSQAETAAGTEDELKSENKKLKRELRKTQDEVSELETANDHLQKRLEKMKNRRKEEL